MIERYNLGKIIEHRSSITGDVGAPTFKLELKSPD